MKIRASLSRNKIHIDPLIYALYKGEKYVTSGTMKEISEEVDTPVTTLYYYLSNVHKRRLAGRKKQGKDARIMVCIGFDDDNEADEMFLDKQYALKIKKQFWKYEKYDDVKG